MFVSYAGEDRELVVRPLVDALSQFGLRVWWDQFELTVGDSLLRTINRGLVSSRYGVVIVSRAFLEKRWPEYELIGLTAREMTGSKVVLPVWYGIVASDVLAYEPDMITSWLSLCAS